MLVLSMNSKRQRRPNVRLGEIGDVPAAFACGFSQKTKEYLGSMRWKHDIVSSKENEVNSIGGFSKPNIPDFIVSDPGVSPRISPDLQQNRENKNPNSSKSVFEGAGSDEIDMSKPKFNFGTVTRKSRVMRRRGRSAEGNNCVFGTAWTWRSKLIPQFSNEDGKDCREKELVGITSNAWEDFYSYDGCKDLSDHETAGTSKEVSEYDVDEPAYDSWKKGNTDDSWKGDACYEGNSEFLISGNGWDEVRFGGDDVNSVKRWLEELGFGKYAGLFEMHEVDEQTLPLLTLEDLKEMGVFAVGHRRKLYTAIQQLRGGHVSA